MVYSDVANTSIFSAAGVAYAQYAITRLGLPMGPTGNIAAGQDRGMTPWIGIKQANSNSPEPRMTDVSGNNGRFLHKYAFNPATLGPIDMNFGAMNLSIYAALTGTLVDSTGEWNGIGIETDAPVNKVQACLIFNQDAQDADALYDGEARWLNWFYPLVNVSFLGVNAEEINPSTWNFRGIPTRASKNPWGKPFTILENGYTRAKARPLTSRYPLTLHTYIHPGTAGAKTFTLDYSPASDETGYVVKVFHTKYTGVYNTQVTPTDVIIASKEVTIPASPGVGTFEENDIVQVLYESFDLSIG